MCKNPFKSPKAPEPKTPAPAPPPPEQNAAPITPEVSPEDMDQRAKRKGRNALRIRLDAGNPGGGTGLNVPQA